MPSEYRIAVKSDLLYARHFGRQTLRGQRVVYEAYLADPNHRCGRPEFIDLSDLIIKNVDISRTRSFASQVNQQFKGEERGTLTVIWAPKEPVYAAARMYQSSSGVSTDWPGLDIHVAREEGEALEALGVKERRVAELLAAHDFGPPAVFPDR